MTFRTISKSPDGPRLFPSQRNTKSHRWATSLQTSVGRSFCLPKPEAQVTHFDGGRAVLLRCGPPLDPVFNDAVLLLLHLPSLLFGARWDASGGLHVRRMARAAEAAVSEKEGRQALHVDLDPGDKAVNAVDRFLQFVHLLLLLSPLQAFSAEGVDQQRQEEIEHLQGNRTVSSQFLRRF